MGGGGKNPHYCPVTQPVSLSPSAHTQTCAACCPVPRGLQVRFMKVIPRSPVLGAFCPGAEPHSAWCSSVQLSAAQCSSVQLGAAGFSWRCKAPLFPHQPGTAPTSSARKGLMGTSTRPCVALPCRQQQRMLGEPPKGWQRSRGSQGSPHALSWQWAQCWSLLAVVCSNDLEVTRSAGLVSPGAAPGNCSAVPALPTPMSSAVSNISPCL